MAYAGYYCSWSFHREQADASCAVPGLLLLREHRRRRRRHKSSSPDSQEREAGTKCRLLLCVSTASAPQPLAQGFGSVLLSSCDRTQHLRAGAAARRRTSTWLLPPQVTARNRRAAAIKKAAEEEEEEEEEV
ncbi:hypothetical protein INR49_029492 [Caranx melampygus]|nr:hypothetical protein INR49_029492 [Caranx melampygus]